MKFKKVIAVVLAAAISFTCSLSAFAAGGGKEGYSPVARGIDAAFGKVQDGLFAGLTLLNKQKNIPTYDEYVSSETEYFYAGNGEAATGNGWKAGYAANSIIPKEWRCDADGTPNENGWCLDKAHAGGGYQADIKQIYNDQIASTIVLSAGTDSNKNGVDDIVVFVSIDGVGVTNGVCREIRKAAFEELKKLNPQFTSKDILAFNVSVTHCHAALDTMGMTVGVILLTLVKDLFVKNGYRLSLDRTFHDTIIAQTADAVKTAFKSMDKGKLSYFETEETDGASDKFQSGAKTKNYFSGLYFESNGGVKTILSNIGAHPVSAHAGNNGMLCTDYPGFMRTAMKDAGYNLVFTQSAQAGVSTPDAKEKTEAAKEWAESYKLTQADWAERYGEKYASKYFDRDKNWKDKNEEDYNGLREKGYDLAHLIINSTKDAKPQTARILVKNEENMLSLEYGLMQLGAVSGIMSENPVKVKGTETGYGVMVESCYMEFGNDVAIYTVPGELSPAVAFGTVEDYEGTTLWTGKQSWTGEEWQYKTLSDIVKEASGGKSKKIIIMGITNDEIGYNLPDTISYDTILGSILFYNNSNGDEISNCMLMTIGVHSASEIVKNAARFLGVNPELPDFSE